MSVVKLHCVICLHVMHRLSCTFTVLQSRRRPSVVTKLNSFFFCGVDRDSVVVMATCYGLDGTGIESRWGEIFRTHPYLLWSPPSLL